MALKYPLACIGFAVLAQAVGEFHEVAHREYVFKKGDRAFEMLIVIDGKLALVRGQDAGFDEEEEIVQFGHCIDEQVKS